MFKNYLKIAFRNIKKNKGYSFISISGLAVGMACCIITLLWIQFELSYDKFHKNAGELYRVAFTDEKRDFHSEYMVGLLSDFLKDEYPEIVNSTNLGRAESKLTYGDKSFFSSGFFVHSDFFEMFTFPFVKGDSKTAFNSPLSIVITEELANKFFGNSDVIGTALRIDDGDDLPITGIVKKLPTNSHIQFEFLLPFQIAPDIMKKWDVKTTEAYVLLDKNSSYQEVSDKISNVYNDHNPGIYPNYLYLQPLTQIHLYALGGGGLITYVYIFSAIAIIVLLIACINFMNLSTACSEMRFKEIGMKKVIGSNRIQLIKQFLSESVLLSFIALIFAVILSNLLLPSISNMTDKQMEFNYSGKIILNFIGIALLTGIISGSYPAFFLSSFSPVKVLKGLMFTGTKSRSSLLRSVLVIAQFSASILFIICAAIIFKQLDYIRNKDLGFNKENVVIVQIQGELRQNCQSVKRELLKNPDIEGIAVSALGLIRWGSSASIEWPGKMPDQIFDVGFNWVDYDYLKTFKMEMAEGRFFSREFSTDMSDAFIVNEATVRAMGLKDPIGKKITRLPDSPYEDTGTIIGVIKDYNTESLHGEIRPFLLLLTESGGLMNIRIKANNIPNAIKLIEDTINKFIPNYPFEYSFLGDVIDSQYRTEQITGGLIVLITIIAISLSSLGLFGLVSFAAEKRTKEIGVRKVLGASISNIVFLLSKDFTRLVLLANIIAWPTAWFIMNRWLENFAFRINIDWWIFIMTGVLALVIAFLTVSGLVFKAARANPVDSLRYE